MKNYLLLLLLLAGSAAYSQESDKTNRLALHYGIGDGDLLYPSHWIGGGARHTTSYHNFGLVYGYNLKKNLGFETGLTLISVDYILNGAPGLGIPPAPHELAILSVPLKARFSFARYFFINGGLLADIEVKNTGGTDDQSGLGIGVGAGVKYDFPGGFGLFVNPQLNWHSLITAKGGQPKLQEAIVNFGIAYSF